MDIYFDWDGFGSPLSLYESSWARRHLFLFLRAGLYLAWSSYERGLCVDVQYIRCSLSSTCLTIAMWWSASRSHGLTFLELRAGELIFLPSCAPEGPMVPIPGHGNMATLGAMRGKVRALRRKKAVFVSLSRSVNRPLLWLRLGEGDGRRNHMTVAELRGSTVPVFWLMSSMYC